MDPQRVNWLQGLRTLSSKRIIASISSSYPLRARRNRPRGPRFGLMSCNMSKIYKRSSKLPPPGSNKQHGVSMSQHQAVYGLSHIGIMRQTSLQCAQHVVKQPGACPICGQWIRHLGYNLPCEVPSLPSPEFDSQTMKDYWPVHSRPAHKLYWGVNPALRIPYVTELLHRPKLYTDLVLVGNVYSYILNFSWERGRGIKVSCLPYMVSGPAILNSVLSVMAVNRMLISGPSPHLITVFYHHKIEAMRIIRKSLQGATDPTSISDDTLIAIVTLSILEVCESCPSWWFQTTLIRPELYRVHCHWAQTLRGLW